MKSFCNWAITVLRKIWPTCRNCWLSGSADVFSPEIPSHVATGKDRTRETHAGVLARVRTCPPAPVPRPRGQPLLTSALDTARQAPLSSGPRPTPALSSNAESRPPAPQSRTDLSCRVWRGRLPSSASRWCARSERRHLLSRALSWGRSSPLLLFLCTILYCWNRSCVNFIRKWWSGKI